MGLTRFKDKACYDYSFHLPGFGYDIFLI